MTNIDDYLNQYNDFDIRKTHDARYVDQKCTPDVVCFIADCILSTSCANKTFTINDLWDEQYFIENCRVIFGKPSPDDPSARNEYNKVLCQPLKLLAYAHVLKVSSSKELFPIADLCESLMNIRLHAKMTRNLLRQKSIRNTTDSFRPIHLLTLR